MSNKRRLLRTLLLVTIPLVLQLIETCARPVDGQQVLHLEARIYGGSALACLPSVNPPQPGSATKQQKIDVHHHYVPNFYPEGIPMRDLIGLTVSIRRDFQT